ncbi:MAG: CorA family divalent cation transporter [Anaerovoracaceae bacterium]
MIKILKSDNLHELEEYVGKPVASRLYENRNFFMPLGEKRYFLSFHWVDNNRLTIYADTTTFVIMTESNDIIGFVEKIDTLDNGILQLYEFFMEITANDVYQLETMENLISNLEDRLLTEKKPTCNGINDIISVRKDLLTQKRYYVQMEFLTDEIAAIDPTFIFIDKKFDRLLDFILHLQEYIEQVREAYQAQIDIEQNNIMKIFTVVTSIFLPLTLIVGWYGMNLQMPEYHWVYGYPIVIGISIVVCVISVLIFIRKKWF